MKLYKVCAWTDKQEFISDNYRQMTACQMFVVVKGNSFDEVEGQRQMFAFAADDYRGKTGRSAKKAVGAILEESDNEDSIISFVFEAITNMVDLVIFDINHVSNAKVRDVLDMFGIKELGYKELQNVYEDRIVFGRM